MSGGSNKEGGRMFTLKVKSNTNVTHSFIHSFIHCLENNGRKQNDELLLSSQEGITKSNNDSQYSPAFLVISAQNGTGPHPSPSYKYCTTKVGLISVKQFW